MLAVAAVRIQRCALIWRYGYDDYTKSVCTCCRFGPDSLCAAGRPGRNYGVSEAQPGAAAGQAGATAHGFTMANNGEKTVTAVALGDHHSVSSGQKSFMASGTLIYDAATEPLSAIGDSSR